ncbi:MAG TPA: polysaccharide biosynthesis/export family protein [Candidatus Binatia bacterium]|nr:polysaccharide biosynthesis/export family protein [Candidatus Binatia bacterium]
MYPFLLAVILVLGACSPRAKYPPPGQQMLAQQAVTPYRIRVGDTLGIRFYKTPELNVDVPVRSDGKISISPAGDVEAAGLEPEELAKTLSELYAKELENPRVTVVVQSFGGTVYVGGEVKTPAGEPFTTGLTALQAVEAAGGFTVTAKLDNVILIRREPQGYKGYKLALDDVLSGKDVAADVRLEPGDVVFVPRTKIADVDTFVDQYFRQLLPFQPAVPLF